LQKAKEIMGMDLEELCLKGPETKLEETKYCQPAMFIAGLAGMEKLQREKPEKEFTAYRVKAMAGLSLGEYTALCAAGVFSFDDGLKLVKLRGEYMQAASTVSKQSMLSVAGIEKAKLASLCAEAEKSESNGVCKIANELFPKGFSCAGTNKAILKLEELATKNGALQAKILKTSGAFHTSLMRPAQTQLSEALEEVLPRMKPPNCRVYMNATGTPIMPGTDPKEIVAALQKQLVSPVLWEPCVREMIKDGVEEFYECGPMKQIKAMMKRIDAKTWNNTFNIDV
jgi:[acyl-carrier-protein] S-malonyltransferase